MNHLSNPLLKSFVRLAALAMVLLAGRAGAQLITNNYVYNGTQGSSPGTNWYGVGVTAYWKLNSVGTAVAPFAGTATATATNFNFFILTNNGVQLGNGTATALIRDPYTSPYPNIATFPGDSLILDTNTQIRFKHGGSGPTYYTASGTAVPYSTPTNNFPGNFGQPGLVLNGGCLNSGDSGYAWVLLGSIYAVPGTISYINPGDTLAGDGSLRAFIINAQLSGSGALAMLNATNNLPQTIQGTSNTFTGSWIVKAGWLRGAGDGTSDGYNSLGTNSTCVYDIDPLWPTPNTFASGSIFFKGPSILDMGPSLANCAGSLILTNGGQMYLHGNVIFQSVTIEGHVLAQGTYSYAALANTYTTGNGLPANTFAPAGFPAGSGTLTVQPPGPPVIPPQISLQPVSEILYPARTASFTAGGTGTTPLYYQWLVNGVALTNGPTGSGSVVSGANTTNLVISNVSSADVASYSCVLSNLIGIATSSAATLSLVAPVGAYETAVTNLNPVAFYQFNETANPATGLAAALDYAGGFNGAYGTNVLDGYNNIAGPSATTGFPGFPTGNYAASFTEGVPGGRVTVPAWNLNTNTVTLSAWVNPSSLTANATLVLSRGSDTVAGIYFLGTVNATTGNFDLSYNWNNDQSDYDWDSGLTVPLNQWSLVTLVVTPNAATIYVMNTNGLSSSTHVYPHVIQDFSSADTAMIGDDSLDGGNGSRTFNGIIDDVAVFNRALTGDQVASLFYTATGVSSYAPIIGTQPVSTNAYTGQTISLTVNADGSEPLGYQWYSAVSGSGGPYTALANGAGGNGETISGAQSPVLTIQNAAMADALDYEVIVTNEAANGMVTSTVATLTVTATSPAENITMSGQEASGLDWNSTGVWSDGNPASVSAVSEPGSTYELLAGSRMRSPNNLLQATFPGNQLTVDGNGIFTNNPAAGAPQAEIRFKQGVPAAGVASVTFPLLIMDNGQLDNGNPGFIDIMGTIDVVSNAVFYVDSGGGTGRGFEVDAQMTGGGSVFYHDFDTTMNGCLDVTCPSNTYTGTWTVDQGPLLGAGVNSLGTNTITIGANGAFETLYNVTDTNANLILNGVMYLHQNDTFHSVVLGNAALSAGTYSAATLCASYPKYFPTNWNTLFGSTSNQASGSLTVLASLGATIVQNPAPATNSAYPTQSVQFTVQGGGNPPLYYQWQLNGTNLTDGANYFGSLSNVLTINNINTNNGGNYTVVISNSLGTVTSAPAVLTVLPTYPAIQPITLALFEPSGDDWNTVGAWNDGQGGLPASTSALEFPGSTYEVQAGYLLRSPATATTSITFPGVSLQIDGTGTLVNNPASGSLQGEMRLKENNSGQTIYFPLLILAGGQIDNGSAFGVDLAGNIDVISNSVFYVDSSGSDGRPMQIDACLTGSGSLEYHDYDTLMTGGLDLTCPTNSFEGTWYVDQGPLLGAGTNSLGTNSITVGAHGALETLYNVSSPAATLSLSGAMYLHQNDTFGQLAINGVGLPAGFYSWSQLNTSYPSNFPSFWNTIPGSTNHLGSGSITVLNSLITPPAIVSQPPGQAEEFDGAAMTYSVATSGNAASYQWFVNGTAVGGATNATFNFNSLAGTNLYQCVVSNSAGTESTITETNIAVDPPETVTFDDTANWTLQGTGITPTLGGDVLTLTDNNGSEASSAFYDIAQYVGGFNASFTYTAGGSEAADGVTFCVQNAAAGPAALGGSGGNLGYFGITNSLSFQINIYALATGGIGIGFGTNGSIAKPYLSAAPINLASGDPINVSLYYMNGLMQVTLADPNTSATLTTNFTIGSYASVVGDSVGYVGFTGADGGSVSSQTISNFSFTPAAPAVLSIAGSGAGSCTLSWSAGVLTNMVLEESSSLTGPWSNVGTVPSLVGNSYQVPVPATGASEFFRLTMP